MSTEMRILGAILAALVLAGPAGAAAPSPRFALWDLQTDLAHASRNPFGDVAVKPRAALAGTGTLVRCGSSCRFGAGWLAFHARPRLDAGDVRAARVVYGRRSGWTVHVTLRPHATRSWTAFARDVTTRARRRGVPDVLVVSAGGVVAATPLGSTVTTHDREVVLTGFSRSSAKALAAVLR